MTGVVVGDAMVGKVRGNYRGVGEVEEGKENRGGRSSCREGKQRVKGGGLVGVR